LTGRDAFATTGRDACPTGRTLTPTLSSREREKRLVLGGRREISQV